VNYPPLHGRFGLILGRGAGVWEEVAEAKRLIAPVEPIIVAVKRAGRDYDGPVHHWASFHPELFEPWLKVRRDAGRPEPGLLWTGIFRNHKLGRGLKLPMHYIECEGGASGLLGTLVGLRHCDKLILCGIPMTVSGRYDDNKLWSEGERYRDAWKQQLPLLKDRVRSLAGWTREMLGAPTPEWINGD